ncbi:MAG: hypothetical protein DWQ04_03970 [Chloroflexi bacterium]|nr:MAG: hypothetical protein DWQ04_03970 [Chloroflexota bacterium]
MRSQLFGFIVQSELSYELLLDCSLDQAVSMMNQHLVEHDAVVQPKQTMRPSQIHYLRDALTIGFEAYMNEWDEEIVELVQRVLIRHCHSDERIRMDALKRALSWIWPKFRETIVLGQFVFATTIDEKTLLTVNLGWNPGALSVDVAITDKFIPLYLRKLEKLGTQYDVVSFPVYPEEIAPKPRKGKPTAKTMKKLQDLVAYRAAHIQSNSNFVGIDKMQACADKNLALKTVKKHAPTLYARWYDANYAGDVH